MTRVKNTENFKATRWPSMTRVKDTENFKAIMTKTVQTLWTQNFMAKLENQKSVNMQTLRTAQL